MRDLQITSKGIAARGRVHDRTSGRHSNFFLENSQMKKTLAAVAVLGAFAGTAMAADVTLYGKIDLGLNYQHLDDGSVTTNQVSEKSGQNSGSRFGLKGTEDLGNGYKVGFVLENGFSGDTGAFSTDGKLFDREAQLNIQSDFGTLAFGRMGSLSSGLGSFNLNNYMAMSTGWGDYSSKLGHFGLNRSRYDNMVTYQTPRFAGVRVSAQYSFANSGTEAVHTAANQRYAGLGVDYANGPFTAGLIVDTIFNKNTSTETNSEDTLGVTLGAAYDFEVVKVFALGQYGQNENKFGSLSNRGYSTYDKAVTDLSRKVTKTYQDEGITGYMFQLGMTAPVLGGTAYAAVSYSDAETDSDADVGVAGAYGAASKTQDSEVIHSQDFKGYGVAVGYTYPMSKRTYLYTYAGYEQLKTKEAGESVKEKNTEFGFGMVHNF